MIWLIKSEYIEAKFKKSNNIIEIYLDSIGKTDFFKKVLGDLFKEILKIRIKEFSIGHSWFKDLGEEGIKKLNEIRQLYKDKGFEAAKKKIYYWCDTCIIKGPQYNSHQYPDDETIWKWIDEDYWFMYQSNRKLKETLKKYNKFDDEISRKLSKAHRKVLREYTSKNYIRKPRKTIVEYNVGISVKDESYKSPIMKYLYKFAGDSRITIPEQFLNKDFILKGKYALSIESSKVTLFNNESYIKIVADTKYRYSIKDWDHRFERLWIPNNLVSFLNKNFTSNNSKRPFRVDSNNSKFREFAIFIVSYWEQLDRTIGNYNLQ